MNPSFANLIARLRYKFLRAPAGFGRPLPVPVLDGEYLNGSWDHLTQLPELPRQLLVAGLAGTLHPRPAVLDIGCGPGRMAQLLQPFSCPLYLGVDLSAEAIRRARALGLPECTFIEADFETWRPEQRFDVVLFGESVGYARDPGALTAAFARHLQPGGHLLVSYYRSGHWRAVWRRIEQHCTVVHASTIANQIAQTWDVKLLQPA